jgi:hypothetical protein
MTGRCCVAGRAPHPLARPLSKATASILPAAFVVLLPKCPLCLAAWLTVATGVSFSATGARWVCGSIVLLWVGALTAMIWRRLFLRPAFLRRLHSNAS